MKERLFRVIPTIIAILSLENNSPLVTIRHRCIIGDGACKRRTCNKSLRTRRGSNLPYVF